MSMLLITTQVQENYGSAEKPYWKFKGGSDYVVRNYNGGPVPAVSALQAIAAKVECDNEMFREWIMDVAIVADDYLTEFERDQLKYEGKITYPATELAI